MRPEQVKSQVMWWFLRCFCSKRNVSSGDEHKHDSSLLLKNVLKSFDPKTIKLQKGSVNDFSEKEIKPDRIGNK